MSRHVYVSDAMIELLSELGCRYLPLNPGSSFRGLHDSLLNYRPAGKAVAPEPVLCSHEEICVAAAHAYAKATGTVGWSVVHDLVGLMHASMAVYNAWCDDVPVVVLAGGGPLRDADRRAIDWLHSANRQSELVRPFVKWDSDPAEAQSLLDSIAQAWQWAASAPRKPAYVTIDAGIQETMAPDDLRIPTREDFSPNPPFAAIDADVRKAASTLWEAQSPVIVAGGEAGLRGEYTPLLLDLVERLGAACRDDRNVVALPTTHPQNLTGDDSLIRDADLLLSVACQDLNRLTSGGEFIRGGYHSEHGFKGKIIELSTRGLALRSWANADSAPRPVDLRLIGEPLAVLLQLRDAVLELEDRAGPRAREERGHRRKLLAERHRTLHDRHAEAVEKRWSEEPISAHRMVGELWIAVRDHDWLLLTRNTRSWPEGLWQFDGAGQYLGHSGGGGVGYGPGAMLGGALAARDRGQFPVGIVGDGDFLSGPGVVWTAIKHRVPLLIVVHNNRSYYNDEEHQVRVAQLRSRSKERAHIGTRLQQPDIDYGMMARSQGAWAPQSPVADPRDLSTAFRRAVTHVKNGGVALVDVRAASE